MPIQICKHVCKILFSFKDIKILIFTKFLNLEFESMHLDILINAFRYNKQRSFGEGNSKEL
jgi:hypothetical protein